MTTKELKIKDLQTINGGTKQDYNNGRSIGIEFREYILIMFPFLYL
ncbi:bacteriocin [Eudoraea sp.]